MSTRSAVRAAVPWFLAVLVLQLLFIASYAGALHDPRPRDVPVAVAGPPARAQAVARALASPELAPVVEADAAAARRAIDERRVFGAVVLDRPARLLVAPAADASIALLLRERAPALGRRLGARLAVADVKPLPAADARGITAFYLVVGWVVGGYLVASFAGVAFGERPPGRRRTALRLGGFAVYAVASGLGGALVVTAVTGALGGHVAVLAAIGALLVFAVASTTALLQSVFGLAGIGVAILLIVVLGNPSSGGPYARELLPQAWSAIGGLLPPGAGTEAVKSVVYFAGAGAAGPVLVLAAYAVAASVATVLLAAAPASASAARPALRPRAT